MFAISLCLVALLTTYWAGKKRSMGMGLVVMLFWGYFFGIMKANLLTTYSFFIFDAAVLGFYLSQKGLMAGDQRSSGLKIWAWLFILWPVVLLVLPFQPFLVSMVGLRGSILFIPMLMAGSRLRGNDLRQLTLGFAVLNLIALAFGGAEYFLGMQRFYPVNAATLNIYGAADVAGGFHRITAIFATAHLYGGTMASSVPFLIAGWEFAHTQKTRWFILLGTAAALMGVLLSATRLNFVICGALILVTVLNGRMATRKRVVIALLILAMIGVAMRNSRFQRFKSLSDTENVEERISGSVNRSFFEILVEYPMGNGLGGGGTSMPYFLEGQVRNPIGLENEYARILSEQGVIGLLLWVSFVIWFLSRFKKVFARGPWATCRRLVWCLSVIGLGTGAIGIGMLTAVPTTAILLLGIGWTATDMREEARDTRRPGKVPSRLQPRPYRPVPALEAR